MLARENAADKDFVDRVHSMYFLATPHKGADHTTPLSNILTLSFGEKSVVSELSPDSASIDTINESFANCARKIQLYSFYESKPTRLMGYEVLIVEKRSATLGLENEDRVMLNADHRNVCKFRSEDDPNYKIIRNHFIVTIDVILSKCKINSILPWHL